MHPTLGGRSVATICLRATDAGTASSRAHATHAPRPRSDRSVRRRPAGRRSDGRPQDPRWSRTSRPRPARPVVSDDAATPDRRLGPPTALPWRSSTASMSFTLTSTACESRRGERPSWVPGGGNRPVPVSCYRPTVCWGVPGGRYPYVPARRARSCRLAVALPVRRCGSVCAGGQDGMTVLFTNHYIGQSSRRPASGTEVTQIDARSSTNAGQPPPAGSRRRRRWRLLLLAATVVLVGWWTLHGKLPAPAPIWAELRRADGGWMAAAAMSEAASMAATNVVPTT